MAHATPSPNLRLSIRQEDLIELQDQFRQGWDLSGALRLLAEFRELPCVVSGDTDLEAVSARVEAASRFIPDMLRVVADGVEARTEAGIRAVDRLRCHAEPRFRLRPGVDLGEVPPVFLRFQDPVLDQEALREAHAQGELPECFEPEERSA